MKSVTVPELKIEVLKLHDISDFGDFFSKSRKNKQKYA